MYKKFSLAMAGMAFSLLLVFPAQGADTTKTGALYNLTGGMSSIDAANALFEQVGASGEGRGFKKVSGLVPGANISGSTQQAADRGEAQAIKRLESAAKQSGRGSYFLGGSKINVIEPGGYR